MQGVHRNILHTHNFWVTKFTQFVTRESMLLKKHKSCFESKFRYQFVGKSFFFVIKLVLWMSAGLKQFFKAFAVVGEEYRKSFNYGIP